MKILERLLLTPSVVSIQMIVSSFVCHYLFACLFNGYVWSVELVDDLKFAILRVFAMLFLGIISLITLPFSRFEFVELCFFNSIAIPGLLGFLGGIIQGQKVFEKSRKITTIPGLIGFLIIIYWIGIFGGGKIVLFHVFFLCYKLIYIPTMVILVLWLFFNILPLNSKP